MGRVKNKKPGEILRVLVAGAALELLHLFNSC